MKRPQDRSTSLPRTSTSVRWSVRQNAARRPRLKPHTTRHDTGFPNRPARICPAWTMTTGLRSI